MLWQSLLGHFSPCRGFRGYFVKHGGMDQTRGNKQSTGCVYESPWKECIDEVLITYVVNDDHSNPPNDRWDVSVWTSGALTETDHHCHPQIHVTSMATDIYSIVNCIHCTGITTHCCSHLGATCKVLRTEQVPCVFAHLSDNMTASLASRLLMNRRMIGSGTHLAF